jgi:hypothetical protein
MVAGACPSPRRWRSATVAASVDLKLGFSKELMQLHRVVAFASSLTVQLPGVRPAGATTRPWPGVPANGMSLRSAVLDFPPCGCCGWQAVASAGLPCRVSAVIALTALKRPSLSGSDSGSGRALDATIDRPPGEPGTKLPSGIKQWTCASCRSSTRFTRRAACHALPRT